MKIKFSVDVELDEAAVIREGQRHGLALQRAREAIVADLECRIHDSIRWRDAVTRVGVELRTPIASQESR